MTNTEKTISTTEQNEKWEYAKKLAYELVVKLETAKEKCDKVFLFECEGDGIISGDLIVDNKGIYMHSMGCIDILFENDPEFDHGLYSSKEEIKEIFDRYEVLVPFGD